MKAWGIQKKIVVSYLLTTFCILVVGWGVFGFISSRILIQSEKKDLVQFARQLSRQIEENVTRQVDVAKACASLPVVREEVEKQNLSYANLTREEIHQKINTIDTQWEEEGDAARKVIQEVLGIESSAAMRSILDLDKGQVAEIFVTDKYGGVVAATNKTSDYDQSDEEWWQKAYNGGRGQPAIGEFEYDESSGVYALAFSIPVYKGSEVIGVMKMVVPAKALFGAVTQAKPGKTGEALLCDENGRVLFGRGTTYLEPSAAAIRVQLSKDSLGTLDDNGQKKKILMASVALPPFPKFMGSYAKTKEMRVVVFENKSEILIPFWMITLAFWGTALACYLLLSYIGVRLANRYLSSVTRLEKASKEWMAGKEGGPLEIHSHDEMENLADVFSKLTAEVKQLKNEAEAAKGTLEKVLNELRDPLFVLDPEGMIKRANPVACSLLGYNAKELEGIPFLKVLYDEAEIELPNFILTRLAKEDKVESAEVTLRSKQGGPVIVRFHGVVIQCRETEERWTLLAARDFQKLGAAGTELSEAKKALEQMPVDFETLYGKLIEAEKLQTLAEVIRGVIHDLNNPLTTVLGFSELMVEFGASERTSDNIKKIYAEAKRCREIIEGLQAYVRKSGGAKQRVGLNDLVERVSSFRNYWWRTRNILVEKELAADLPLCDVDPNPVQQALMGLFSNAEEAMLQTPDPRIKIKTEKAGPVVRVTIEDNGCGVSQQDMTKLGTPFFTTKPGKLGLGLCLVNSVMREQGGKMKVESRRGKGAAVTLEFPSAESAMSTETLKKLGESKAS